jgi:hypothetical protein
MQLAHAAKHQLMMQSTALTAGFIVSHLVSANPAPVLSSEHKQAQVFRISVCACSGPVHLCMLDSAIWQDFAALEVKLLADDS